MSMYRLFMDKNKPHHEDEDGSTAAPDKKNISNSMRLSSLVTQATTETSTRSLGEQTKHSTVEADSTNSSGMVEEEGSSASKLKAEETSHGQQEDDIGRKEGSNSDEKNNVNNNMEEIEDNDDVDDNVEHDDDDDEETTYLQQDAGLHEKKRNSIGSDASSKQTTVCTLSSHPFPQDLNIPATEPGAIAVTPSTDTYPSKNQRKGRRRQAFARNTPHAARSPAYRRRSAPDLGFEHMIGRVPGDVAEVKGGRVAAARTARRQSMDTARPAAVPGAFSVSPHHRDRRPRRASLPSGIPTREQKMSRAGLNYGPSVAQIRGHATTSTLSVTEQAQQEALSLAKDLYIDRENPSFNPPGEHSTVAENFNESTTLSQGSRSVSFDLLRSENEDYFEPLEEHSFPPASGRRRRMIGGLSLVEAGRMLSRRSRHRTNRLDSSSRGSSDSKELISAYIVEDDPLGFSHSELVTDAVKIKTGRRICIAFLVTLVVIGLVVGISVSFSARSGVVAEAPSAAPSGVPSASPSFSNNGLQELLMSVSSDRGVALQRQGSPQSQAYEWLITDFPQSSQNPNPNYVQLYSLAVLYFSTGGERWPNSDGWLKIHDECEWFSAEPLCDEEGDVVALELPFNLLRGSLPPEIGLLTKLENLQLWGNLLTGRVPDELQELTKLTILDLRDNVLSGTLPNAISKLTALFRLSIGSNLFEGTIPTKIGDLDGLKLLFAHNNRLEGSIPSEIGNITALQVVELQDNRLSGEIPSSVGYLDQLMSLDFSTNRLTGTIPSNTRNMSSLSFIHLQNNHLTGTIPSFNLTFLQELELGSNNFFGPINEGIFDSGDLEVLSLNENHFTGFLPTRIGDLEKLRVLDLSGTDLSGTLPTEIGLLGRLKGLRLELSLLSGVIPTEIGKLSSLLELNLWSSLFDGPIPSEIGMLSMLVSVDISSNAFTGKIPKEIGGMEKLRYIDFSKTRGLTGTIPTEIGKLKALVEVDLSINQLTGQLPGELATCDNLEWLSVASNYLSGTMPWEFVMSENNFVLFAIQDNNFTGTIGEGFCNHAKIRADCFEEIDCSCCTECCLDGHGCTTTKEEPIGGGGDSVLFEEEVTDFLPEN